MQTVTIVLQSMYVWYMRDHISISKPNLLQIFVIWISDIITYVPIDVEACSLYKRSGR